MDLTKIKAILEEKSQVKTNKKTDKKNVYWKPPVGKKSIRVVPSIYDPENPFTELSINYALGKTIISLENFGEKDPIVEFTKQLRKTGGKEGKENWRLARQLEPKTRVFLPVIVRGEEEEGVKLWQFGKEVYMQFLQFADNEDVGDFTDVTTGRDIEVTTMGPDSTGTQYNKSTLMPKMKTSLLSEDPALVEKWLNNQPKPIDQFTKYDYDKIKEMLQNWLADDEDEEVVAEESAVKENPKVKDLFKE